MARTVRAAARLDGQQQLPQLLVRIEAEVQVFRSPARVGIAQALYIDAARQASFDGCLDELGSEECERERQN